MCQQVRKMESTKISKDTRFKQLYQLYFVFDQKFKKINRCNTSSFGRDFNLICFTCIFYQYL